MNPPFADKRRNYLINGMDKMPNLTEDLRSTIEYIAKDAVTISYHPLQKSNGNVWAIRGPQKNFIVLLHYVNNCEASDDDDSDVDAVSIKQEPNDYFLSHSSTKAAYLEVDSTNNLSVKNQVGFTVPPVDYSTSQLVDTFTTQPTTCKEPLCTEVTTSSDTCNSILVNECEHQPKSLCIAPKLKLTDGNDVSVSKNHHDFMHIPTRDVPSHNVRLNETTRCTTKAGTTPPTYVFKEREFYVGSQCQLSTDEDGVKSMMLGQHDNKTVTNRQEENESNVSDSLIEVTESDFIDVSTNNAIANDRKKIQLSGELDCGCPSQSIECQHSSRKVMRTVLHNNIPNCEFESSLDEFCQCCKSTLNTESSLPVFKNLNTLDVTYDTDKPCNDKKQEFIHLQDQTTSDCVIFTDNVEYETWHQNDSEDVVYIQEVKQEVDEIDKTDPQCILDFQSSKTSSRVATFEETVKFMAPQVKRNVVTESVASCEDNASASLQQCFCSRHLTHENACYEMEAFKLKDFSIVLERLDASRLKISNPVVSIDKKLDKCSQRKKKLKSKRNLKQHIFAQSGDKRYKCLQCDKKFFHISSLNRHKLNHGFGNPLECSVCKKTFTRKHFLNEHMRVHTGSRSNKCLLCGNKYAQKSVLHRHMLTHAVLKRYECTMCDTKFYFKGNLERHQLIHNEEKFYKCLMCDRQFTQQAHLSMHMVVHTEVKLHACSMCNKKFSSKVDLQRHRLTHAGNKPYNCSKCLNIKCKCSLNMHNQIPRKDQPLECPQCGKNFQQQISLIDHSYARIRLSSYSCSLCDEKFFRSRELRKQRKLIVEKKFY